MIQTNVVVCAGSVVEVVGFAAARVSIESSIG